MYVYQVEAASDRICVASKGVLQPRISSENMVSCCTECGYGCNGGYPIDAWRYLAETGVPTGGLYNPVFAAIPRVQKGGPAAPGNALKIYIIL